MAVRRDLRARVERVAVGEAALAGAVGAHGVDVAFAGEGDRSAVRRRTTVRCRPGFRSAGCWWPSRTAKRPPSSTPSSGLVSGRRRPRRRWAARRHRGGRAPAGEDGDEDGADDVASGHRGSFRASVVDAPMLGPEPGPPTTPAPPTEPALARTGPGRWGAGPRSWRLEHGREGRGHLEATGVSRRHGRVVGREVGSAESQESASTPSFRDVTCPERLRGELLSRGQCTHGEFVTSHAR